MTDLVLGFAHGYDVEEVRPFIASLRSTGYSGDIVLLIAEAVSPRTSAFYQQSRVEALPVSLSYPYSTNFVLLPGVEAADVASMAPHLARYLMYRMLLAARPNRYQKIFLSDVRDVVFQAQPFAAHLDQAEIVFCLEDAAWTIDSCAWNRGWILRQFGREVLKLCATAPISCSGTTYGTAQGIRKYLEAMVDRIVALRCVEVGGDQGIHNVLLAECALAGTLVASNESGLVMTLGHVQRDALEVDPNGVVSDSTGRIPAIVHQYDRHPDLTRIIAEKYHVAGASAAYSSLRRALRRTFDQGARRVRTAAERFAISRAGIKPSVDHENGRICVFIQASAAFRVETIEHYRKRSIHEVFVVDGGLNRDVRAALVADPLVTILPARLWLLSDTQTLSALVRSCSRGRWTLLTSDNEIFLYPHAAKVPLDELCSYLEERGVDLMQARSMQSCAEGVLRSTRPTLRTVLTRFHTTDDLWTSDRIPQGATPTSMLGGLVVPPVQQFDHWFVDLTASEAWRSNNSTLRSQIDFDTCADRPSKLARQSV